MWVMHDPGWREALLPTLACCTSTLYIHRTSQTSNHQNSGTFWHFTGQTLCTLSVKKTKLKRFLARILLSCAAYYASAEALFGTGQDSRDLGLEERGTDLTLYPVVWFYVLSIHHIFSHQITMDNGNLFQISQSSGALHCHIVKQDLWESNCICGDACKLMLSNQYLPLQQDLHQRSDLGQSLNTQNPSFTGRMCPR